MSRNLNSFTLTLIGVLMAAGLGFGYATDRIGLGTLVVLVSLALAFGVITAVFLRKMSHPDESVEQILYKTDHPTHL